MRPGSAQSSYLIPHNNPVYPGRQAQWNPFCWVSICMSSGVPSRLVGCSEKLADPDIHTPSLKQFKLQANVWLVIVVMDDSKRRTINFIFESREVQQRISVAIVLVPLNERNETRWKQEICCMRWDGGVRGGKFSKQHLTISYRCQSWICDLQDEYSTCTPVPGTTAQQNDSREN